MSGRGRYDSVGIATLTTADGHTVSYLRRRFLPQPGALGPARPHSVVPGERVDLIAARELGDSERWWLLADASAVPRPSELSITGATVLIPRPGGIEVAGP